MSDLDITISLDPGPAATSARKVTEEVKKTESAAVSLKEQGAKAFDSLAGTFKRLGAAMAAEARRGDQALSNLGEAIARAARYEHLLAEEARKATQAQQRQAAETMASVKGFHGLTEAIRREQEMLDRIHGPMQRLQRDLQVLDKLQRDGKISAEQHAQALLKSAAAAGLTSKASGGGGAGAGLGGIAAGVDRLKIGQIASGANQAFELLNQKLQLTDNLLGSAVGSAIKFGAAGAQIAGPWGAAIGAVTGLLVDLGDDFGDWVSGRTAESKRAAAEARAYIKEVEYQRGFFGQLNAQLDDQNARLRAAAESTRHLREAQERLRELQKSDTAQRQAIDILAAQSEGYQKLVNDVRAYTLALLELQNQLGRGSMGTLVGGGTPQQQRQQVELARAARDARIQQIYAEKGYASAVAESIVQQNRAFDRQVDMASAVAAGVLPLRALNKELGVTAKRYEAVAEARAKWATRAEIASVDTISGGTDVGTFRSATAGMGISAPTGIPIPQVPSGINWERLAAANREAQDALTEYNQKLAESKEKLVDLDDVMRNQLIGSAGDFASILVDGATAADASWSNFFSSIGDGLLSLADQVAKAITQALILKGLTGDYGGVKGAGGWGGLFGLLGGATGFDYLSRPGLNLPGFATGGDIYTRGAGSTDSALAMFRITPGESIHVRTPQQRAEAAKGGGGNIINNNVAIDPRALLAMNSTKAGQQSIINVIQLHAPLIAKMLGR